MSKKPDKKRVNINFGIDMYNWLKAVSDELNVPVSSLIIMAVQNMRMQQTVIPQIEPMLNELNKNKE